jgi:glutaredoxin/cytochrome c biogenesis protein CcdA
MAQEEMAENPEPTIFMFGRDDCGFCKAQFEFMDEENLNYEYLNIVASDEAKELYNQVTAKHDVAKVTPISIIGERIVLGFDSPLTTGESIKLALREAESSPINSIEDHLTLAPKQEAIMGGGCTELGCEMGADQGYVFDLPLVGVIDLKSFSLFSLSLLLGVIDGFNPCAMWVLITFLTLLSQAGSKKKMVMLAGIFILAQGIMYNLILNVWYKTWDFVALDQYVTPAVGFLALGGGLFFLWRWNKNRAQAQLVCDISDIETQSKTINKFQEIVNRPVTIMSVLGILVIAFSVNVIEFACSIGIPQAYTKILELNMLSFLERQWYILIFTLGYMVDDVVVFALAIWGYSKLQSHGGKYAQLSLLIGGVLMLALGLVLVFNPSLLVL